MNERLWHVFATKTDAIDAKLSKIRLFIVCHRLISQQLYTSISEIRVAIPFVSDVVHFNDRCEQDRKHLNPFLIRLRCVANPDQPRTLPWRQQTKAASPKINKSMYPICIS